MNELDRIEPGVDFERLLEAFRRAVVDHHEAHRFVPPEQIAHYANAEREAKRVLVEAALRRPRQAPTGAHDLWQKADNYGRGVGSTPDESEPAWTTHLRECRTCVEAFMCAPSGKKSYCDAGKVISDGVWKRAKDRMS